MTGTPTLLRHWFDGLEHGLPLLLGPSLGTSARLWAPQLPALARRHRVLRYDLPGHGETATGVLPRPEPGATRMGDLADLVLDLVDHYGWDRFAYIGTSLGGAIGLDLAIRFPERISSLAVVCCAARFAEPASWHERAALVRAEGTEPLVKASAARWFADPARALTDANTLGASLLDDLRAADPAGYAACCDALAAFDARADLGRIRAQTVVIAGRADPAVPPARARELADGIGDATLVEIPGAAHLAGVDRPTAVTSALLRHLGSDSDESRRTAGFEVRRTVLGDAHVDRAVAATSAFTADFQDFITRYAWGEIWSRPGLDRRIRSAVALTALIAHGHERELAMHIRGGLNSGLSRDEIKEILLQSAVYCGVPAANTAFSVAQKTFDELDAESER